MPVQLQSHIPWPQGFDKPAVPKEGKRPAEPARSILIMPGNNTVSDEDWAWLKLNPDFRKLVSEPREFSLPPLTDGSPQKYRGIPITTPGQSVQL